uniref:Promyelocytic leukemia n=1 Tax=Strigops habroptila TaxID=2489341 RepID=A0A672V587_STRHB
METVPLPPGRQEPSREDDFQFILCEGCQQESTNLKLLTCLHTLCLGCLSENKPIGQCPVCSTAIPQASGIPDMDNLLFTNLQARLKVYKKLSDSGGPSCSRCRVEAAAVWCSECEEFLCTKCFEDHQWFFKKRNHKAKRVEELRAESAHQFLEDNRKSCSLFCSTPALRSLPTQTSLIYCQQCEKALCCSCALLDSRHTSFCDIRSETQRRQQELGTITRALRQQRGGFEATCAALQGEAARLERAQRELRELIRQRVEQLVRLLRREEEELLGMLEARQEQGRQELARELQRVEGVLRRMEAGERLVEKMSLYATEQEVMDMQPFIKGALQDLQRLQPPEARDRTQAGDLTECRARLQALVERVTGHPGEELPWGCIHRQWGLGPGLLGEAAVDRVPPPWGASKSTQGLVFHGPGRSVFLKLQHPPLPSAEDTSIIISSSEDSEEDTVVSVTPWDDGSELSTLVFLSLKAERRSEHCPSWVQRDWGGREGHPKYLLQPHSFSSAAQHITEVAATNGERTFKTLIQTPESVLALLSQGVSMEVGIQNLLWYLSLFPRPILIVYNFWAPELPALFKALDATGRKVDFCRAVHGYVDMLSLIKDKIPKASSYKLKNLLRKHLQQQLKKGSALATAKALQELWGVLELPARAEAGMLLTHCNLQSYTILQALVQEKLLTRRAEALPCEGAEALAQGAQRSCGCPIPGSVQGQVGHRGLEQPALVEGVPARGRGLGLDEP